MQRNRHTRLFLGAIPGTETLRQLLLSTPLLLVGGVLTAGSATTLYAQVGAASVSGTVLDTSGAAIPGAVAVLHNNGTGTDRKIPAGVQAASPSPPCCPATTA